MFVKLEDAIEIVVTLAADNILDEFEALQDPEILIPEREKQLESLAVVQDFFVNHVFE